MSREIPTLSTLSASIGDLGSAVSGIIGRALHLAALECQQAALSLSGMLGVAVLIAILGVSAWLMLLAAIAIWLAGLGLRLELALLGAAFLNLGLGLTLVYLLHRLSRGLRFEATRRQLNRSQ